MHATSPSTPAAAVTVVAMVAAIAVMAAIVTIVSPASEEPLVALAGVEPAAVAYHGAPLPENGLNPRRAQPI